jgi:hypothetical protein
MDDARWREQLFQPTCALRRLRIGTALARLLSAALCVHWQADLDDWLAS